MVVRLLVVAVVAVMLAAVLIAPAHAADAPGSIGMVDVAAVFQGYERTTKSNGELEAFRSQLVKQLETLSEYRLLDDNESKELADLVRKPNPTEADKQKISALQEREKALDKELKELQAKKEPTEQEKARLKELQDRTAKADDNIAKLKDESEQQFDVKKNDLSEQIRADILKAIETVAKDKKLTVVVDKMAVLFGGTDVTDSVMEKLNGKKN